MKKLIAILLVLTCVFAPATFTGCSTPRTHEAVVFDTCKTTYNTAREAYKAVVKLHLKHKLSDERRQQADQAWSTFRHEFFCTMRSAGLTWKDPATSEVEQVAYDLIYFLILKTL